MGSCLGSERQNRKRDKKINIGSYHVIIEQKIAEGAYGDIWKCKDAKTKQIYAAKEIKLQTPALKEMYEKQILWLEKFKTTPGIVRFMGSLETTSKQNEYRIGFILTEFCEKTLFDELKNHKFTVEQILEIMTQLLRAIKQIHTNNCIHLDIKPQNILIDHKGSSTIYKICDFGSCRNGHIDIKSMNKSQKSELKQYIEANSTLMYRAPELIDLQSTKIIDSKADIWMLGCLFFLMVYRQHPFQDQGPLAIMTGRHEYSENTQIKSIYLGQTKPIIQLIKLMLTVNPQQRADEQLLLQEIQNFGMKK